ncbi:MAG: energy-coupling factor transporter transmembrane protein EcfT [Clostridia bacterium]|nr:energy-coupling factor transporter transmembrane protein EcfT [Clostridia bacterium]
MLRDITLGQYFPGNSVLHRADPRTSILLSILFIVTVFFARSAPAYGFILLLSLLLVMISKIPLKTVLRGIRPLLIIMIITALLNVFWHSGEDVLFSFWKITVYKEGVIAAVYMIVRIFSLIVGTSVILSYTTSPLSLADGLERLLAPLKLIKLPVHEFSMMMTIAMRFIPTLIDETDKITSAQKSRGADLSTGGLVKRAKALIPILIPLFISSFRRADELATAMECRCYRGGKGRTRMNELRMSALDFALLFVFSAVLAGVILLSRFLPYYAL